MQLLEPDLLEGLLCALAVAAACMVRPWRLLAHDSPYRLLGPICALGVVLPALWWWPGALLSPALRLFGANLALLMLGWPLAVLLYAYVALCGAVIGYATVGSAATAMFWHGVLPMTLALACGYLVRRAVGTKLPVYLLGRGFLLPLLCTFGAALLAQWLTGRFEILGPEAGAALFLISLMEATGTGMSTTLLVCYQPQWLATWSDTLYLPKPPRRASA